MTDLEIRGIPRAMTSLVRSACGVGAALLVVVADTGARSPLDAQTAESSSGGRFVALAPYQQRLFAQVLERYNAIAGTGHTPAAAYEALPPSRRTTFEAVTNALATTALTDDSGAPLGPALDVVEGIDEILGEVRGARGDRQFRLLVLLAPDALDRLTRSREFTRTADNTIYHPGYPVSFRLRGGTPSIQVSISRDRRRGDIDVDYRSSRFPAALVNGHLTSANSDVRAGGNYDRHQRRWSGLGDWWQQLLALFSAPTREAGPASDTSIIPVQPPLRSDAPIEAVVADFLSGWLVESRPQISAAYFSPVSFACMRDRTAVGQGLERYVLLERMRAANGEIGVVGELGRAAVSVNPWDPRLQVVRHPLGAAFLLARVPPDVAAAYDCVNRGESDGPRSLTAAEFHVSAFRLRVAGGRAPVLVLLWAKEPGGFRIVAIDVEEAAEPSLPIRSSRRSPAAAAPRARRVAGPRALIEAATAFHRAWFAERDSERALTYFDVGSYRCLAAVSDGSLAADPESMRTMIAEVGARTVAGTMLASAIRTVEPAQSGVEVVDHASQAAFSLVPVSDAFADRLACDVEPSAPARDESAVGEARGNRSFVSYFQLNVPGDPAYLWMLWKPGAGGWQITYWTLVTP